MPSKPDIRAQLAKLLEVERDLLEKLSAVHHEMDALVNGDEGIGPKVTRLKALWLATWAGRYQGQTYVFNNHAMVGASLKRWLVSGISEHEIGARMFTYVKTDDQFYVRARHSFEIFVRAFNQLVGLPKAVNEDTAEQSAQRAREMRGQ